MLAQKIMNNERLVLGALEQRHGISIDELNFARFQRYHDDSHHKTKSMTISVIGFEHDNGGVTLVLTNFWDGSTLPAKVVINSWDVQRGDEPDDDAASDKELAAYLKRMADAKLAQQRAAALCKQAETKAASDLRSFPQLAHGASTTYLDNKGIPALGVHLGNGYNNEPFLAVPASKFAGNKSPNIKNNIGYQRIFDDGRKYFQAGMSPTGTFHIISDIKTHDIRDDTTIYIVEGYATGVSSHISKKIANPNHLVVVAWNTGNLKSVAELWRKHYPYNPIVGIADNDCWPNANGVASHAGVKFMLPAMESIAGSYIIPNFTGLDQDSRPTDINDMHKIAGAEEVARQLDISNELPKKSLKLEYISLESARRTIKSEIDGFFDGEQSKIIKASAGVSKTYTACEVLKAHAVKEPHSQTDFYVPSHDLGNEIAGILKTMGVRALVVRGRSLLCEKNDVPNAIIALGGAMDVASHCCENIETGKKCMSDCPYITQFDPDVLPHVIIYVHAYLPLPRSKYERQLYRNGAGPDRIIIDESFYTSFIGKSTIARDDIFTSNIDDDIKKALLTALDWERPVLQDLSFAGLTAEMLREEADKIPSHIPDFGDISPDQTTAEQLEKLSKKTKGPYLKKPLLQIAEELESTTHLYAQRVSLVPGEKVSIASHWRRPFTRNKIGAVKNPSREETTFVPTLIMDASLDFEIVEQILGEFDPINRVVINVKSNMHVTQLQSNSMSKFALTKDAKYLADVVTVASSLLKNGKKVGIFGPMSFIGKPDAGIPRHKLLDELEKSSKGCANFGYFNKLRGLNDWKHSDCVIFSRNQPPSQAIEDMARAFYGLDDIPINFGIRRVPTAYTMRDGTLEFAMSLEMNDARAQKFMLATREAESEQAIARIRALDWRGAPLRVVILSNLPLPGIIVDELITTRHIRGTEFVDKASAIATACFKGGEGVLSLSPKIMMAQLSAAGLKTLFRNDKSSKNWIVRNGSQGIITALMSYEPSRKPLNTPRLVNYKVVGMGGRSMQAITTRTNTDTALHLSKQYGKNVNVYDTGVLAGDANARINKIALDPTLETADDVLEAIAITLDRADTPLVQLWNNLFLSVVETLSLSKIEQDDLTASDAVNAMLSSIYYNMLC